jgi:hypothetical protein
MLYIISFFWPFCGFCLREKRKKERKKKEIHENVDEKKSQGVAKAKLQSLLA